LESLVVRVERKGVAGVAGVKELQNGE